MSGGELTSSRSRRPRTASPNADTARPPSRIRHHNLLANPEATVEVGREAFGAVAVIADEAEHRARTAFAAVYPVADDYQATLHPAPRQTRDGPAGPPGPPRRGNLLTVAER